jgi:gamma-glutamylcyclotransferase (GGCT)/AIG2-like uncharacterized protein YtfP
VNRAFVCGSLKKGQRNYHDLHQAGLIGHHSTEACYWMIEFDDYRAGAPAIHGEIYRVSKRQA